MPASNRWGSGIHAAAPLLLLTIVGAAVWTGRRFTRYAVAGESMRPALRPGDWVVVDRAAYRTHLPRAGDIIIALDPRDGRTIVKRIGLVNAEGLELLGDNAKQSTDSRTFGPVAFDAVLGRVLFRYWPVRRSPQST